MTEETRQSRNIKIKPSILRKAHHEAIESQKKLGVWLEVAIEEKIERAKEVNIEKTCVGRSFWGKFNSKWKTKRSDNAQEV